MSLLYALRHRLRTLLRPGRYAREMEEEMQFHLSLEAMQRAHAARGALSPADARYAALRRFGNVPYFQEETRRMAGLGFFDMARQDLRFALRSFRRTPAFTAVAVLTLAVGIGANTALFSAVDAMLLRPLPYPEPERLMKVSITTPANADRPATDDMVWSHPKFTVFRDAQTVFADLALSAETRLTLRGGGEPEQLWGELADAHYLRVLGVRPTLGRGFLPEEDRAPGGPKVAVLSHALWTRRFSADPSVLGRAVSLDGAPYTVVGVAPRAFRGLAGRAEFWIPVMSESADDVNQPWMHSYTLIGRRKPGVSAERARAEVHQLGARVDAAFTPPGGMPANYGAAAHELDAKRVDPVVRRSLLVLLGAAGLVLLIACANVANLFLLRATGRRREIAVRLAVGAGRARLVRQLLTESLLLSTAGGLAGLAVAWYGVRLLAAFDPTATLRTRNLAGLGAVNFGTIQLDPRALAVAALLALATGLLFGLVPALQATRPSLSDALKEERGAGAGGRRRSTTRGLLAGAEIALAVVLLAGSGLMLRSLAKLLQVRPGFDGARVLTMRVGTPDGVGRDSVAGFYDRVAERLAALPGAQGAALADCPPLNGRCAGTAIKLHDRPKPAEGVSWPLIGVHWVTPEWFPLMKVPLRRGRLVARSDRLETQKVVLVNEAAARAFWPGADPVGKPVGLGVGPFWTDTAYVVGVVGDVRYGSMDSLPKPEAYLSLSQAPRGSMMLFVRTAGDPLALAAAARRAVRELAPDVAVAEVRTMEERTAEATAYARFGTTLLALFAAVALALATMGTYGVISFAVSQRTREIGVRVALGATRRDVLRLIVGQGLGIAAGGALAGLLAALLATRVLQSQLFGVAPSDPLTFVAILAVLLGAVVAASWIPARRAAGVPPVEALRE